jgi:hypothetical protein
VSHLCQYEDFDFGKLVKIDQDALAILPRAKIERSKLSKFDQSSVSATSIMLFGE